MRLRTISWILIPLACGLLIYKNGPQETAVDRTGGPLYSAAPEGKEQPQAKLDAPTIDTSSPTALAEIPANLEPRTGEGDKELPFADAAIDELTFEQLVRNPKKVREFLDAKVLTLIRPWTSYESYPTKKFLDGDMLGRFEGKIDEGKGRIVIILSGEKKIQKDFAGRVAVHIFDSEDKVIAKSVTLTRSMNDKLRIDPESKGLLLLQHKEHRFVVQLFRGVSDAVLIGNLYEYDGLSGLSLYGSFTAQKTPSNL